MGKSYENVPHYYKAYVLFIYIEKYQLNNIILIMSGISLYNSYKKRQLS